jgi:hypothetical protein
VKRFVGVLLAAAALACSASAGATTLLWTNPPDRDLAKLRFYVTVQDSFRGAWILDYPIYFVSASGDTTWRSLPGQPDSLAFTGACRSVPVRYAISCTAVDFSGNESGPSNGGIPVNLIILP